MHVYHEAKPEALAVILKEGLRRTSRGEKGNDHTIIMTDKLLDERRPARLSGAGVSRDDNLYGYIAGKDSIIDITDGKPVPVQAFIKGSKQAVLRLEVEPKRCYISDLDAYDAVADAIENGRNNAELADLAQRYWDKVILLASFSGGRIRRPEVMITYDVPPDAVEVCSRGTDT